MKLDALKSWGGRMWRVTAEGEPRRVGDEVRQKIVVTKQTPCRGCGGTGWVDESDSRRGKGMPTHARRK